MQTRHYGVWPEGTPKSLDLPEHSVYENLLVSAARAPDRPAFVYFGATLTFADLADQVARLAGFLSNGAGIGPTDRVAVYMQNAPQFVIAYYAVLAANAVVVPVNPMCRRAELSHILKDSGARALIYGAELAEEVAAVHDACGKPALIPARYADYAQCPTGLPESTAEAPGTPWFEALSSGYAPPDHDREASDWCIIPYSSGTTGLPKGCLHSHASVNAVLHAYRHWIGMRAGTRVLASLPLCHVTGMQHSMNLPIFTGATTYLTTRWNAATAADLIESERIQHWRAISTMMIDFLSLAGIENRDLSSLEAIGGGGAQMPEATADRMSRLIGLDFIEAYGLSETMAPTHINPVARPKKQCLGIPIFDVDARIVDPETDAELGPGEPGEIVLNGPQVFLGYWNNPDATEAAFMTIDAKRFFRSGDIGVMDDEGYFFFVDRLKRMVNVSGLKVWPAEIEAILHSHPDIAEACVVGDPHPRTGEAVRAVIVPKIPGSQPDDEALTAWCNQNMARYKVPRRFEFRTSLPRSGTGKVLWKDL